MTAGDFAWLGTQHWPFDAFPGRFEVDPYAAPVEPATLVGRPVTSR